MRTSDISGKPIDPDRPSHVTVRLPDGTRRRITITAAEADGLKEKGEAVSGLWLGRVAMRNWKTVAALIVASVLVPAATRQWSDRQSILTVKQSLITEVSDGAVAGIRAAQEVPGLAGEDEARIQACDDALDAWVDAEATIDPVFALYFPESRARALWSEYRDVVYDYVALSGCSRNPRGDLAFIREYFDAHPLMNPDPPPVLGRDPWAILAESTPNELAYQETYGWLGQQILRHRGLLHRELLAESHARGYCSGFADFLREVLPGLSC